MSQTFPRVVSGVGATQTATRVLLIEDDPLDAELFKSLLARAFPSSFSVEVHSGLQTALSKVRDQNFDCVCVDLRLPDATGTECVRELIGEAPSLPVVVLTGSDNEELALESVRAGAEDYLVKGHVSGSQIGHALRYACERKRNQLELASAAHQDPLTGLSNRRHFEERLARSLSHRSGTGLVSVVLVDLDNFKPVNDAYGHAAGDALLVELARRLVATVRDTDVCARLGGDEFAIILTQVHSLEEADEVAERVRKAISAKFTWNDHELAPTASIGVATSNDPHCTVHSLIDSADVAMYEAKRSGGNRVRFASPLNAPLSSQAIAPEDYYLVYQPVLSKSGQVVSQEALLRSAHHDEFTETASTIVPKLARLGRLDQVMEAVVRDACSMYVSLRRLGKASPTFAINIASEQLSTTRFSHILSHLLGRYDLQPTDVELEVHLTHREKNNLAYIDQLSKLASMGFAMVLDEFCEDHISLLRSLPIAGVKLSAQFQNDGLANPRARNYLTGVVALCHSLGVWVGATRVETAAQLRGLLDVGCDRLQGYYLGRPNCFPVPLAADLNAASNANG